MITFRQQKTSSLTRLEPLATLSIFDKTRFHTDASSVHPETLVILDLAQLRHTYVSRVLSVWRVVLTDWEDVLLEKIEGKGVSSLMGYNITVCFSVKSEDMHMAALSISDSDSQLYVSRVCMSMSNEPETSLNRIEDRGVLFVAVGGAKLEYYHEKHRKTKHNWRGNAIRMLGGKGGEGRGRLSAFEKLNVFHCFHVTLWV